MIKIKKKIKYTLGIVTVLIVMFVAYNLTITANTTNDNFTCDDKTDRRPEITDEWKINEQGNYYKTITDADEIKEIKGSNTDIIGIEYEISPKN